LIWPINAAGIHEFGGHIAVGVDRALGQAQVVAAQIRPARNLRRHEIRDAKVADGRQRPGEIAVQFAEIQIGSVSGKRLFVRQAVVLTFPRKRHTTNSLLGRSLTVSPDLGSPNPFDSSARLPVRTSSRDSLSAVLPELSLNMRNGYPTH
jgi:hypothetical protein